MGNYSRSLSSNKEESSCACCAFRICMVQGPPLKTSVYSSFPMFVPSLYVWEKDNLLLKSTGL